MAAQRGYYDQLIRDRDHPPRKYPHEAATKKFNRRKQEMLKHQKEEREQFENEGFTQPRKRT